MSLPPGTRIGSYEVLSLIGEGGMGEVYRARDLKLNRDVAVKVLPARYATDPERLARFEREAMFLASLNHPRIGAVYGAEHADGAPALVLELIEGPTLADRIARGRIGVDEAIEIGRQLVEALEAAHANGIVHRDLKPSNIKVRPDGAIKVLDFGIAKLRSSSDAHANAPTAVAPTQPGVVLGTASHMSPEQARGEPVDQRADIWAFGVVVFEMVTGRTPFAKASTAETIVAILGGEPDFGGVPAPLHRLLRSCLQKDPKRRLRDIGDARLFMDEATAAPIAATRRNWLPWTAAAIATLVAAGALVMPAGPAPVAAPPEVVRFQFEPAASPVASGVSAISPNGRHFAYMGVGADGAQRMWIRDLDSLTDRSLPGTEVSGAVPPIFWSPDSRFIAYDAGGRLRTVDRDGGLPSTICDVKVPIIGGTWNRNGVIVFSAIGQALMQVSDQGGTPTPVPSAMASAAGNPLMPVFLQDGNHLLYLRAAQGNAERNGIVLASLDGDAAASDGRVILSTPTSVAYRADGPGRGLLLFLRNHDLMAQSFDEARIELMGDARLIAKGVDSYRDGAAMSVSNTGTLVYLNAAPLQLVWSDRSGRIVTRGTDRGRYETLTLSPDGTKAIVSEASPLASNTSELWLFDFSKSTKTKLTDTDAHNAVWSPDGSRAVFATMHTMSEVSLGGGTAPTDLLPALDRMFPTSPTSWSADGQFLLYTVTRKQTAADVWVMSPRKPGEAIPVITSSGSEMQAQFSPEPGRPRWIAYTANGSGREEVFLREFDAAGSGQLVSIDGGHSPRWRRDGRELFYVSPKGELMVAPFPKQATRPGTPVKLFDVPAGFTSRDATDVRAPAPWDVTPDGQRFVFAVPAETTGRRRFSVVLNWEAATTP